MAYQNHAFFFMLSTEHKICKHHLKEVFSVAVPQGPSGVPSKKSGGSQKECQTVFF